MQYLLSKFSFQENKITRLNRLANLHNRASKKQVYVTVFFICSSPNIPRGDKNTLFILTYRYLQTLLFIQTMNERFSCVTNLVLTKTKQDTGVLLMQIHIRQWEASKYCTVKTGSLNNQVLA